MKDVCHNNTSNCSCKNIIFKKLRHLHYHHYHYHHNLLGVDHVVWVRRKGEPLDKSWVPGSRKFTESGFPRSTESLITLPAGKRARALTSQQAPTLWLGFDICTRSLDKNLNNLQRITAVHCYCYWFVIVHHIGHQAHNSLAQSARKQFQGVVISFRNLQHFFLEENLVHVYVTQPSV